MESLAAGIFSLLLGVVGLWTGLKQLRNRAMLDLWQTTPGRVIERGTYQPNVPASGPPAFRHAPLVRYSYQVNGKEFINNSIQPKRIQLPPHNTIAWARKKAESFPPEVVVHYNPEDPSESYLIQTSKWVLLTVVAVSLFVILVGVVILLMR